GFETTKCQLQRLLRLLQVHQHPAEVRNIEALAWQVQLVDAGDRELHIAQAGFLGKRSRAINCFLGYVKAEHVAWRHQFGEAAGEGSGTAPEVDKAHAWAEMRHDEGGIAIDRPQIEQIPSGGNASQKVPITAGGGNGLGHGNILGAKTKSYVTTS